VRSGGPLQNQNASSLTCFIRRVHQHHQHAGQHHHFGGTHAFDANKNTRKKFGFLSESRTNPLRVGGGGWRGACPAALHSSRDNTRFAHDTQNKIIRIRHSSVLLSCRTRVRLTTVCILLRYNTIITVIDVKTYDRTTREKIRMEKNISRQERKTRTRDRR